eukprot:m.77589 g.77589  ORF g.77589 m.77589 type:complete len:350 (+) comp8140_c0_seq2:1929-2978(+)
MARGAIAWFVLGIVVGVSLGYVLFVLQNAPSLPRASSSLERTGLAVWSDSKPAQQPQQQTKNADRDSDTLRLGNVTALRGAECEIFAPWLSAVHTLGAGVGGSVSATNARPLVIKELFSQSKHLSTAALEYMRLGEVHPNVAMTYMLCDSPRREQQQVLVSELISGDLLPDVLAHETLAPATRQLLGRQIALIFDHFHTHPLRPFLLFDAHLRQLMVDKRRQHVTMIDIDAIQHKPQHCRCPKTPPESRAACPDWRVGCSLLLPPESQCGSQACDQRSEVYALGQILWYLLEGPRLPPADRKFTMPSARKDDAALVAATQACLVHEPALRPTAKKVAEMLMLDTVVGQA